MISKSNLLSTTKKQKQTYKSKIQISLMAWSIGMSLFHFGYLYLILEQIPTDTIKQIYNISIENGLTEAILNGCIPIGGLIGALGSSFFWRRFSRRKNMLIINYFAFIIGILIYINNFPMLIICRLCQGIYIGFFTSTAPLIIKQISPNQISGSLGSYIEINISIGLFIGCIVPYLLLKITGDDTAKSYWFLLLGIPQIVIIIQVVLILFVFPYETPKYLLSVGKEEEAKNLIEIIYKIQFVEQILQDKKTDLLSLQIKEKFRKMQQSDQYLLASKTSTQKSTPTLAIIVSIHLSVLQQFSGINIVGVYATTISNEVASGELVLIMPSLINFVQFLATFASFFLLHKIGRKTILMYGTVLESLANALITIGFFIKDTTSYGESILLIGIFLFIVGFGMSLGPIVWLYISEVVQPEMMPYSIASNWASGAIVIIFFPILINDYLSGNPAVLFIFSTVWCTASCFFNYFFVLQTKDKTQKDIRVQYEGLKIC